MHFFIIRKRRAEGGTPYDKRRAEGGVPYDKRCAEGGTPYLPLATCKGGPLSSMRRVCLAASIRSWVAISISRPA